MSNPKVFEFAKEVGLTPLALMDKIREWQLPVKSHMSELDPETLGVIKVKLAGPATEEVKDEKKAPAKKRAAARTKTTIAKPATAGKAKASGETATKTKSAVVRRKKADVEAAAEAEAQALKVAQQQEEQAAAAEEVVEAVAEEQVEAAPAAEVVQSAPAPEIVAEKVATVAAAESAAQTPAPVEEEKKAPVIARKKEVAIGNSGVASSAPKRNIVGRMDLSRVTPQGPPRGDRGPRPGGPGAGNAGGGGFASGGVRPKGNIRAGFVQASPMPESFPQADFGFTRKKDDKRRGDKAGDSATSTKANEEEEVKHFDAAEFRKREMVFQPKKKKGMLNRPSMQTQITTPKASKRIVEVNQSMKVSELAIQMGVKAAELTKNLMKSGVMATMNTELDFDTISLIVSDFGYEAVNVFKTADELLVETAFGELDAEKIIRPPVVTIMGHVDHGKTSLLDAIRNANVASGEAGGITQHIGAYQVTVDGGQLVTFLDTPGHEAFTAMRARGANVTDIAIIVVAADDGAMPQTVEAVSHAKAAGVPIIVAVNKMDKQGANPDKIKQQLTEYQLVPEEWGGDTIFVPVSAVQKTGIKELLEQILLVAEVGELKANPKRSGTGTVIESKLDKGRGPVATILVQDGTVRVGEYIVAGVQKGRVRSLMNDRGERVKEGGPGSPLEVLGLEGTPIAGDKFDVVKDERAAEKVIDVRKEIARAAAVPQGKMSLEDIFAKATQGEVKELPLILKADVTGSMEAIIGMLNKASTKDVKVKIVHSAVGGITESDVLLAQTANGIIVGFNVRPDTTAQAVSKRLGIDVRTYSIVYEMMDEIRKAMSGLLTPDVVEEVLGRAEVRNTFSVPKIGTIAGCLVADGKIQRNNLVRLIRDGKIVYEGKISSLKRFKDDAKEVAQGFECGIGIENFNDVKVGDSIESYIKKEVARELDAPGAQA